MQLRLFDIDLLQYGSEILAFEKLSDHCLETNQQLFHRQEKKKAKQKKAKAAKKNSSSIADFNRLLVQSHMEQNNLAKETKKASTPWAMKQDWANWH